MDAQPGLSLGLSSPLSSPAAPLSDNSFSFMANSTPSVPWRLHNERHESVLVNAKEEGDEEGGGEEEENDGGDETINFMDRRVCVKRQIEEQHMCFPSKRVAVESVVGWWNQPLGVADPEIFEIMEKEKLRQFRGIELIASENFVCRAVMEALGSHLTNKYSEGMPGAKYYTGNQYIDQIEFLCCQRALLAFDLHPNNWGVNVQPYSCTSANFAVYTGLLHPGDRIMGLDSPSGGHLSHGYYTLGGKKVSAASIFFETLPYKVNPHTGYIDYEKLEEKATDFRPKILICGGSSYPREWDYARFRQIADKCGAVLICDMAHISGLVAAKLFLQEVASPFDYCDIVTSTTHKSLRGPRGGIIFYRRGTKPRKQGFILNHGDDSNYDFEEKINFSLYPSLQGGPHNNHIAALAIALKQVATPEYKAYMQQVKKNAQTLASALLRRNCRLVTGGTDNHLLLWDLTALGLIDRNYEKVCEACHITLNKCAIYGSISPGGVRIGTPAMTSRGCLEEDFETIADFLLRAAQITSIVQREHGKSCKDFLRGLQNNKDISELRSRVETFSSQFAMPGFDT
ncbi:serine hydroxymethyltransferase 7-like isoform X2 [Abrus precatorius]|uniref:Serine hydroxymethyltransferase n=1 Tax=Abrus precatorius TaxID=3816 RepID=A0A8B8LA77_ABRPR|nr:serine hydroxymethyltransferase 7-like isoform X2 [Abrus precatorius]